LNGPPVGVSRMAVSVRPSLTEAPTAAWAADTVLVAPSDPPYRLPTTITMVQDLHNKPPCGAMRGHGGPQAHFAQDVQLDMIAEDSIIR